MASLENLLAVAAIIAAYGLGRWRQAQVEQETWATYWAYLRERRGQIASRFRPLHTDD